MEATRIGLDLSKSPFELHGVNEKGEIVLRRTVRVAQLQEIFAQLPQSVVGLESCGTAHQWGQRLAGLGHEVRLIAPHAVAAYRGCVGAGASQAQVICEALGGATTRFIRIKADKRPGGLGLFRIPAQLLTGFGLMARPASRGPSRAR